MGMDTDMDTYADTHVHTHTHTHVHTHSQEELSAIFRSDPILAASTAQSASNNLPSDCAYGVNVNVHNILRSPSFVSILCSCQISVPVKFVSLSILCACQFFLMSTGHICVPVKTTLPVLYVLPQSSKLVNIDGAISATVTVKPASSG